LATDASFGCHFLMICLTGFVKNPLKRKKPACAGFSLFF
jgi:hypothetical protein